MQKRQSLLSRTKLNIQKMKATFNDNGCVRLPSPASAKSNCASGNLSTDQRKVEGMIAKTKSCRFKAPWHARGLVIIPSPICGGVPGPRHGVRAAPCNRGKTRALVRVALRASADSSDRATVPREVCGGRGGRRR